MEKMHYICKRKGCENWLRSLQNAKTSFAFHSLAQSLHRKTQECVFGTGFFLDKYMGKSYTASSLQILQGLTAAKVVGWSGAM